MTVLPFDCAARWLHLTPSGKVRERSPAEARTHASRVEEPVLIMLNLSTSEGGGGRPGDTGYWDPG